MNFLLFMLGQSHRTPLALRPTTPQQLRTLAANSLAQGRLSDALAAISELATPSQGSIGDTLIRAHLHLAMNQYAAAESFFSLGIDRIGDVPRYLDRLIDTGEADLRKGHYHRALDSFQSARAAVDTLISAHSGLTVASARLTNLPLSASSLSALLPLVRLGDLLLRMLAHTHLAGNLADCLRQRSLRDDLASWATSTASVENLLAAEHEQFTQNSRLSPSHAELHYRLGLVARALNRTPSAAAAFSRVLALHPHHLPAAARLAATFHELGQTQSILPLLAVAFAVPPNLLQQYSALAAATANPSAFDQTADALPTPAKPNLAFALSELGLLDTTRAEWREPALA